MNSNAKLDRVRTIIKQISPLLAGQDPKLVGAVLAGLTAMWVAGRVSPGNPEETEQVLARHITASTQTTTRNAPGTQTSQIGADSPAAPKLSAPGRSANVYKYVTAGIDRHLIKIS